MTEQDLADRLEKARRLADMLQEVAFDRRFSDEAVGIMCRSHVDEILASLRRSAPASAQDGEIEVVARILCPIAPDSDTEAIHGNVWYKPGIPHWQSWCEHARLCILALNRFRSVPASGETKANQFYAKYQPVDAFVVSVVDDIATIPTPGDSEPDDMISVDLDTLRSILSDRVAEFGRILAAPASGEMQEAQARIDALNIALDTIASSHLPDCPAGIDELSVAKNHVAYLRRVAHDAGLADEHAVALRTPSGETHTESTP